MFKTEPGDLQTVVGNADRRDTIALVTYKKCLETVHFCAGLSSIMYTGSRSEYNACFECLTWRESVGLFIDAI